MRVKLLVLLFFISSLVLAKEVPIKKVELYSAQLYQLVSSNKSNINLDDFFTVTNKNNNALYHIINFKNGFVIISADDRIEPLLAYSTESSFNINNIPEHINSFLNQYREQIEYALNSDLTKHPGWTILETNQLNAKSFNKTVSPIINVNWDQGAGWNRFCPEHPDGPEGHTYVGCVAVAMAQAMSVYNYPNEGYFNNIENTSYDWNNMNSNSPDDYNSLLLYHCALSVNMNFGPDGSGAYTSNVPNALKKNFDYSKEIYFANSTEDDTWIEKLKTELDNNKPIIYKGSDASSENGHAFNVDGYNSSDFFHINWGWNGSYNGYYKLNALIPGQHEFSFNNGAVFSIAPMDHSPTDLYLGSNEVMDSDSSGKFVSKIYVVDPDQSDEFSFSISCLEGDFGFNSSCPFYISNDSIFTNREIKLEEEIFYINIKCTDSYNCIFTKSFLINVIPYNSAPTDITLSDTIILNNIETNSLIGTLNSIDQDINDTHTYTFSNECSETNQNRLFEINGNELYNRYSFSSISDTIFKICIESSDGYNSYNKEFNINIKEYQTTSNKNVDLFNRFEVYPNPVTDKFSISLPDQYIKNIHLINLSGNVVKVINHIENKTTIDIQDLNCGVYFIYIELLNGSFKILKVVKQ